MTDLAATVQARERGLERKNTTRRGSSSRKGRFPPPPPPLPSGGMIDRLISISRRRGSCLTAGNAKDQKRFPRHLLPDKECLTSDLLREASVSKARGILFPSSTSDVIQHHTRGGGPPLGASIFTHGFVSNNKTVGMPTFQVSY